MAINGNQWQSMAINGNQWQSHLELLVVESEAEEGAVDVLRHSLLSIEEEGAVAAACEASDVRTHLAGRVVGQEEVTQRLPDAVRVQVVAVDGSFGSRAEAAWVCGRSWYEPKRGGVALLVLLEAGRAPHSVDERDRRAR